MSSDIVVRPGRGEDLGPAQALNDAAVPAVNALSPSDWTAHLERADLFAVAMLGDDLLGFVVCLGPGHDYPSPNYQWFLHEHGTPSFYVDRIVVDPARRGYGVGRALYQQVFEEARRRGLAVVTCEVNERPPNPGSIAFHQRLGFREVGRQSTEGGAKAVVLLESPVGTSAE